MDKFKIGDHVTPVKNFPSIKSGEVATISAKYDDYGRMTEEAWWINCPSGAQCWLLASDMMHALTLATPAPAAAIQAGDIVESVRGYPGYFTIGKLYKVTKVQDNGAVPWVWIDVCDTGGPSSWDAGAFKFHSGSQLPASTTNQLVYGDPVPVSKNLDLSDLGIPAEIHFKDPEEERKERIWRALQGAAKQ